MWVLGRPPLRQDVQETLGSDPRCLPPHDPAATLSAKTHHNRRGADRQRALSDSATQPPRPLTQGRPVCLHASSCLFGPRVEGDGDLESRQERLKLLRQFFRLSACRPDECDGLCPELLVGHRHDYSLIDPLQPAEGLLYLLGLDVLAARDKEVVHASSNP